MITACVILTLWTAVHLSDWWIPYTRDLPANAARFSFYPCYTQLLPVVSHHYPPDAAHAILDALVFPTTFLAIFATFTSRTRSFATA